MKNWIGKNYKTLIIAAFLIPIITVAIVSISHVTKWYGISNPVTWAVYLSIGVEIAALSALAAISANMGKKVYFPFAIVTLAQFIGNIFFAYSFIQIESEPFRQWVELVSPLLEYMGVEPTDFVGHKRFLAFFAGGMLPIISLSFLHMLVKFTEEDRLREIKEEPKEELPIDPSEIARGHLSEEDLKKLEEVLLNPPPPNEALVRAAEKYKEEKLKSASLKEEWALNDEEILKRAEEIQLKRVFENAQHIKQEREEEFGPDNVEDEPTALANSQYVNEDKSIFPEEVEYPEEYNRPVYPSQEERARLLSEMMKQDQELGLYDEPFDNPLIKEEEISSTIEPTQEEEQQNFSTIEPIYENNFQDNEVVPALGDDEVREMFMDEWERKFDLVEEELEEERQFYVTDDMEVQEVLPKIEEEVNNFNSFVVPVVDEIPQEELEAIENAIVNETVPEPFATPEEIQKFNLDGAVFTEVSPEPIQTPEPPQIEIEVSNDWNEPSLQETEEELKKNVQNNQ